MIKTGLFFGSFNPIHIGHMAIANYFAEFSQIKEVWFIVSPQNPFKEKKNLLESHHRFDMIEMIIKDDKRFQVSDIEFRMPKPSYTIDTLSYLKEKNPKRDFSLIMGADQLPAFHKWKNPEQIISNYRRYIYPRMGVEIEEINKHKNIELVDAPIIQVSSSFIRKSLAEGKDVRYFLHEKVFNHIDNMGFYR